METKIRNGIRGGIDGRHARSFIAAIVPGRNESPIAAPPRLILSLKKLRVYAHRAWQNKRKSEKERERRLCVDPRQGYEAALRIRNRVYTNEVDGVRGERGSTSFPSVSTTSERGREITGTRDRRIGWRMCTQRDWCSAATHWRLSAWKLENFHSYAYMYIYIYC